GPLFVAYPSRFIFCFSGYFWCQVSEGDMTSLTNGVQSAATAASLVPGHEGFT
ncbi:hypothetical protein XENOCAPTIV_002343, partial [Xenoophorus captivus]